jgi:hypothetical protein
MNTSQYTQTLQLFTININTEIIYKSYQKMPSWRACDERSEILVKDGLERKR